MGPTGLAEDGEVVSGAHDDEFTFDPNDPNVVRSSCEFCGKAYYLDTNRYALIHDMPYCAEFDAMDVLAFARENRRIKEARVVGTGNN